MILSLIMFFMCLNLKFNLKSVHKIYSDDVVSLILSCDGFDSGLVIIRPNQLLHILFHFYFHKNSSDFLCTTKLSL